MKSARLFFGRLPFLVGLLLLLPPAARSEQRAASPAPSPASAPASSPEPTVSQRARAILVEHCLECHGGAKTRAKFNLATREGLLQGGESGPAVSPGKADDSLLLQVVMHASEPFMPHQRPKLPDHDVAAIRAWIDAGASYDAPLIDSKSKTAKPEMVVTDRDRQFWSFRPLQASTPPEPGSSPASDPPPATRGPDDSSAASPIDRFILAKLASQNIHPSPAADRRTLARRLVFDLTGLPPTPEEIDAFLADASPAAYEALIDKLLASPRYGERWARHWLDVARYADSDGYETDSDRPTAYHYRDFVIRALNDDLPFDQFLQWQLAGDELDPENPQAQAATGFVVAGPHVTTGTNLADELARYRYNELDDMLATTSAAMLGLTIGCARCHDHKYDPIPTRDYYRLLAAFSSTRRREAPLSSRAERAKFQSDEDEHRRRVAAAEQSLKNWLTPLQEAAAPAIRQQKITALPLSDEDRALLATTPPQNQRYEELSKRHAEKLKISDADYSAAFTAEQNADLKTRRQQLQDLAAAKPQPLPTALALVDTGPTPEKAFLLDRSDALSPKEEISLGFLTVLSGPREANEYLATARSVVSGKNSNTSGQRAALAMWMTDVEAGAGSLVARVIVNRLWQHHFGEGLVRTASDFGSQGESPSHPELLEWLASDLVTHGWRIKRLQKLIVSSAAYRRAVSTDPALAARDPENRLLARRRPVKLESEALRDAILAISGRLNLTMYGPGVKPPIPAEALTAYNASNPYPRDAKDNADTWRRSVYLFTKRSARFPLLETFDGADPSASCARRIPTIVAPQSLTLLNDPFVRARAKDFAERVMREAAGDGKESNATAVSDQASIAAPRIDRAYRLALGRWPSVSESAATIEFIAARERARRAQGGSGDAMLATWTDFCQLLFGLNEFLYVD